MSPAVLDRILSALPRQEDPRLIVGFNHKDDAGIFRLREDLALVQTTDFFTPIVDDPRLFGQIAAANSLSDVYAMGGKPQTALSIVCYPEDGDLGALEDILAGGMEKMMEAECTVVGGHMVRDSSVKFGYAVTGTVDPKGIWMNMGAKPGDVLLLTKPLGTGVIATAIRAGKAEIAWIKAAIGVMSQLNKAAAAALSPLGHAVHAVTDVTGFGLLGHALEMATSSGMSFRLNAARIELIHGAVECVHGGFIAGGLEKNQEYVGDCVKFSGSTSPEIQKLLFDPQTSGGLLVAVTADSAEEACSNLANAGCSAAKIGEVLDKTSPPIEVY
jgi:selenide,water dikinase